MKDLKFKKIILGLNKSDVNAFNELFSTYYVKVFNFCMKSVNKNTDAEEITQEVFIVVWQNREKIDPNTSFLSYLFGIAKNKVYNFYRRSLYVETYINYKLSSSSEINNNTEETVLYNELNKAYESLIEQLPVKRREIFVLSRKKGYSYKEIAKELNISENTVDVQLRKALDFLRARIRQLFK